MTQIDPMLAQDKDKAEKDSMIGWLERRLEHASSRTIPMYVGTFQDMWAKQFGTLEGIPQELKNHTNALYQQRMRGET